MLSLLTAFYCKQFSGAFEGGKKVHCLLGFNSKKMNVFQIKVLWKEQTSSPAHNDNLNWIEKFQYATAATAAATSSSIYSISIQARCCFALFHPQHNCGYMCSFTWAQIFVFGSIGFISLAYNSLSDVGESRVWFASKNMMPCRMHWNDFLIAQIIAKCHSFPNMYGML